MTNPAALENSIDIDATPHRVWQIVGDVRNAPQWSDQAVKVLALGEPRNGQLSLNVNKQAGLLWTTTSRIVDFQPRRRIANRILENSTVWAFELEPLDNGGTRLIERRETPQGISRLSRILVKSFFGGQEKFSQTLDHGVSLSLQRIKRLAEQG